MRSVLVLVIFGFMSGAHPGDEPETKNLTTKQVELEAKINKLAKALVSDYQKGDYDSTLKKLKNLVSLQEELYENMDHPDIATTLNNIGAVLIHQGKYADSLEFLTDSLEMSQRLNNGKDTEGFAGIILNIGTILLKLDQLDKSLFHMKKSCEMYKRIYKESDHPKLASAMNNLGAVLEELGKYEEAIIYYKSSMDMLTRLYPEDPNSQLADSFNNMGNLLNTLGQYRESIDYHTKAIAMRKQLYNNQAHPRLASSLKNIAETFTNLGQTDDAIRYYMDALAMRRRIFMNQDHTDIANSLDGVGGVLFSHGQPKQALPYFSESLEIRKKAYGDVDHVEIANTLNNLGFVFKDLGRSEQALASFNASISMYKRLYNNRSHHNLARSLNNIGFMLSHLGRYEEALLYYTDSLMMFKIIYPNHDRFEIQKILDNIGEVLRKLDRPKQAYNYFIDSLRMQQRLVHQSAVRSSTSEALALFETYQDSRLPILSLSKKIDATSVAPYKTLWTTKSNLTRLLRIRHSLLSLTVEGDATLARLQAKRRQMTTLFNQATSIQRDSELADLTRQAEQLERDLLTQNPVFSQTQAQQSDLAHIIPNDCHFVDFYRYYDFAADAKDKRQSRYTAFILDHTNKPIRVELGSAKPIEDAILAWRNAIIADDPAANQHAEQLRKLVWLPIENAFSNKPEGFYICTDEDLGRVPFAALPNGKGGVLLEDYALATVPSGPFLLEQLTRKDKTEAGAMLLAGGIDYGNGGVWPQLKGTNSELAQIRTLAGERKLLQATDDNATTDWLMEALPKARFAHLATHGFFKADEFALEQKRLAESRAKQIAGLSPTMMIGGERSNAGVGVRNPLGYVGLVMAQANNPPKQSLDAGIASGVALMNLDLSKLDLAVLSACETGLGEFQSAAGVQNLQLAFHVAGCRNVIASLWKVDDLATSALMACFYQALWMENQPPMEALRTAQLYVYHNPAVAMNWEQVANRGEIKKALKQPENYAKTLKTSALPSKTPVKYWAAFTLSGAGK